ncbi:MAG: 50S ribosomal protein L6 [Parachlamydiales bacterium]
MSRSGKAPIVLPSGVEFKVTGRKVAVKGPKDTQEWEIPAGIDVAVEGNEVVVSAKGRDRDSRRRHGLTRALVNNMVVGCSKGFEKRLEMVGVGYRAAVKGKELDLLLQFSHPTAVPIPEGLQVKVEENVRIIISGPDKQRVGQFAARIRALRPPEPYKGKGVRYADEYVRRKAGKAAK